MTDRPAPWASAPKKDPGRRGARPGVTVRDLFVGVASGIVVAGLALYGQNMIDDQRDTEAERRENLRFIREQSANGKTENVSFRGIDLAGRNLGGLDLHGADLAGANLVEADLTGADFAGANLYRADLTGARVVEVDFSDAHMTAARLRGATVDSTNFNDAVLDHANMRGIKPRGDQSTTDFTGANLYWTDFTGAELPLSRFHNTSMDHTDFSGADLSWSMLPIRDGKIDQDSISSICYDSETRWPKELNTESLEQLRCSEWGK